MKIGELKTKNTEELQQEVQELLKEKFNLRMQKNDSGEKPRTHNFKRIRRDIARIKTILHEKEGTK